MAQKPKWLSQSHSKPLTATMSSLHWTNRDTVWSLSFSGGLGETAWSRNPKASWANTPWRLMFAPVHVLVKYFCNGFSRRERDNRELSFHSVAVDYSHMCLHYQLKQWVSRGTSTVFVLLTECFLFYRTGSEWIVELSKCNWLLSICQSRSSKSHQLH